MKIKFSYECFQNRYGMQYVVYFTKLITQNLPVTNTYDKNWSFVATFMKKCTLVHKFRQAGPVSYSSDKMVLCR